MNNRNLTPSLSLAPPPAATLGVQLPCPYCGEQDAIIDLHLADGSLTCEECSTDFTPAELEALFAKWRPVLAWIQTMPSGE